MKHWKSWLGGVMVMAAVATPGIASANQALAQKNACLACHAVDKKLVGPAFQDIAKKYTGQADAQAQIAKSIKAGGSGKWGPIPMPAQAALSEADAGTLAAWILAGSK
ncbi:Cytochrome c-551 [compost metagenome]